MGTLLVKDFPGGAEDLFFALYIRRRDLLGPVCSLAWASKIGRGHIGGKQVALLDRYAHSCRPLPLSPCLRPSVSLTSCGSAC